MKCQKCGKNEANTHVKTLNNGEYAEFYLCPDCAKKMGYGNVFTENIFADMENEFSNMLGSFFSNALPAKTQATRCDSCQTTYNEIAKTGQVGCADCYTTFWDELFPSIRRIHGNTTHCGKVPSRLEYTKIDEDNSKTEKSDTSTSKLETMKSQLDSAIKSQNFEEAAKLRDEIKELEDKNNE